MLVHTITPVSDDLIVKAFAAALASGARSVALTRHDDGTALVDAGDALYSVGYDMSADGHVVYDAGAPMVHVS